MNDFHKISNQTLEEIAEFFENSWPEADVDLLDGGVSAKLPKNHEYVINKHGVTQQIWLSSPFTGAHHFRYVEGAWRCTRTDVPLEVLLQNERNTYAS